MKKKARQEWLNIHMPKLLTKSGKARVKTAPKAKTVTKASKVKKRTGTQVTVASMMKGFKPPPPAKKRALKRSDFLSKLTPEGKKKWSAIRNTLLEDRGTTTMPVTKWVPIKKENIGDAHGSEGFVSGQEKVTTMEETGITRWKDVYSGETITDPDDIQIDHTVSIDRAKRSGAFKKVGDAQAFGSYLKNLVITKGSTNIAKGAKDLGEYVPTHEPKKYAQRYGDVMSDWGLVMTHGEGRAYKKHTGEEPKSQVQHILDMQRGEPIAETQTRHDMWMMRARKK